MKQESFDQTQARVPFQRSAVVGTSGTLPDEGVASNKERLDVLAEAEEELPQVYDWEHAVRKGSSSKLVTKVLSRKEEEKKKKEDRMMSMASTMPSSTFEGTDAVRATSSRAELAPLKTRGNLDLTNTLGDTRVVLHELDGNMAALVHVPENRAPLVHSKGLTAMQRAQQGAAGRIKRHRTAALAEPCA